MAISGTSWIVVALLTVLPTGEGEDVTSAWQDLLRKEPVIASRASSTERAILQEITTEQLEAYLSGTPASAIVLSEDRSLEDFLRVQGKDGTFDLSWCTIDGGGGMTSQGGAFKLSATIAQADAGVLANDNFKLTGGFWAIGAKLDVPDVEIFSDGFESGDCTAWSSGTC